MSSRLAVPPFASQQSYKEISFTDNKAQKPVHLRLLKDVSFIPPSSKITSVSVVPFIKPDQMVAVILERGLDIPGGHVEPGDRDVIHTVEREAYEEAYISLAEPMYAIGVIASDYRGEGAKNVTYMLITAGRVDSLSDFRAEFESTSREVVAASEFLKHYQAGPREMMMEIINRANSLSKAVLFN